MSVSKPPATPRVHVREASWQTDRPALERIREAVFIREQGVPTALEWDSADATCLHALAETVNRDPVGTGRLEADGKIGRIAILRQHRNAGIGAAVLQHLIREAQRRGMKQVYLFAQVSALAFYQRHGFVPEGNVFMEAGIPHRRMQLRFEDRP